MSPRRLVLWLALLVATCLANPSSLPDFDAWQRVLSQHVTAGVREGIHTNVVDYEAIKLDPDYNSFVQSLEHVEVSSLTKNETYAVFMNAYNALAMKMVIGDRRSAAWLQQF